VKPPRSCASESTTYTSAPVSPVIQPEDGGSGVGSGVGATRTGGTMRTADDEISEEESEEEEEEPEYKMYVDGCSKGNPGRSGAGAVLYENGKEIWSAKKFVGEKATNNVAEYNGLILALQELSKRSLPKVVVYGDS